MDLDEAAAPSSCSVCLESFTVAVRKPVACPYCHVAQCMLCSKKCALTWASAPKCASCNKAFTDATIDSMFPKNFRRGALRIQVIQNLQEQEMSLLPQTMQVIEERRAAQKVYETHRKYSLLLQQLSTANNELYRNPLMPLAPYVARISELQDAFRVLGPITEARPVDPTKARGDAVPLRCPCPSDNCRGFLVLSGPGAKTSCALCNATVCKKCNSTLASDSAAHVCNENDALTWQAIKESTVRCPKCCTAIQKISGCNQMWCTIKECNTAFDWLTGRIINGPIHNPHYHEWLRASGTTAVPAGAQCQGGGLDLPRVQEVYRALGLFKLDPTHIVSSIVRILIEALDPWQQPAAAEAYTQQTYLKLRIDYIESKISKATWASKLSHKETLRIKKCRLRTVFDTFVAVGTDVFNALHQALCRPQVPEDRRNGVEAFVKAFETLRIYYNAEVRRILQDYSDSTARLLVWAGPEERREFLWSQQPVSVSATL